MMLYIFLDDDLRERVELEISDAFEGDKGVVQIDKLLKAPLLNSICNEVLRLRVGSLVGRTSESTLELSGGSKLQPGIPVMSANWLGGLDTKFWNTGRVMPDNTTEHPLDRFWAERFLEYHDDVASGPLHKDHLHGEEPPLTQAAGVGPVRCARVVTNGLQSHWFPFGGGAYRCPGEALAKQTMLVSVAVVLKELHIELQNPGIAAATGSKHRTLPFGSHAFDRVVPFRIRVRDAE
jgi:cytochrome P450